jgi:hypothetical protein
MFIWNGRFRRFVFGISPQRPNLDLDGLERLHSHDGIACVRSHGRVSAGCQTAYAGTAIPGDSHVADCANGASA